MNAVTMYRPLSIDSALDDFDRLVGSFFGNSPLEPVRSLARRSPAVDVSESEDAYKLEAELPGLSEKDVEVRVEGRTLTIESVTEKVTEKAEKSEKTDEAKAENRYLVRERRAAAFNRSFTLPEDADTESISASFSNGVLELDIKKRPEAKRRVVKIASR